MYPPVSVCQVAGITDRTHHTQLSHLLFWFPTVQVRRLGTVWLGLLLRFLQAEIEVSIRASIAARTWAPPGSLVVCRTWFILVVGLRYPLLLGGCYRLLFSGPCRVTPSI